MSSSAALPGARRIGVFGGAFDPPHRAHAALALVAVSELLLDELRIVPTGQAWHKARHLSAAGHRLAMTRLAFEGVPHVVVDDRELQRAGPSFTIDTLEALQDENPGAQLYLIMGEDQFLAFKQWHRWKDIAGLAIICIAGRAMSTGESPQFDTPPGLEGRLVRLRVPLMAVSATQIRQLIASGADKAREMGDLVSEPVARYIASSRLYNPR